MSRLPFPLPFPNVIFPETVSCDPELKARVPSLLPFCPRVTAEHFAVAMFTVTDSPALALIVAVSPEPGKPLPSTLLPEFPQVAPTFQLPAVVAVNAAARPLDGQKKVTTITMMSPPRGDWREKFMNYSLFCKIKLN